MQFSLALKTKSPVNFFSGLSRILFWTSSKHLKLHLINSQNDFIVITSIISRKTRLNIAKMPSKTLPFILESVFLPCKTTLRLALHFYSPLLTRIQTTSSRHCCSYRDFHKRTRISLLVRCSLEVYLSRRLHG